MIRASRLLKILPYVAGVLMACVFLVGLEISSETAALFDSQQAFYQDPIDVQVFWLQGRACVILPPDNYIAKCSYVTLVPVMVGLTIMFFAVLGAYALLRKRVTPLPPKRRITKRMEEEESTERL
jgi:hypothetical protein